LAAIRRELRRPLGRPTGKLRLEERQLGIFGLGALVHVANPGVQVRRGRLPRHDSYRGIGADARDKLVDDRVAEAHIRRLRDIHGPVGPGRVAVGGEEYRPLGLRAGDQRLQRGGVEHGNRNRIDTPADQAFDDLKLVKRVGVDRTGIDEVDPEILGRPVAAFLHGVEVRNADELRHERNGRSVLGGQGDGGAGEEGSGQEQAVADHGRHCSLLWLDGIWIRQCRLVGRRDARP
jgi:hypothetical protein